MSMVKFIDITRTNFDNLSTKSDKALFFVKENNNTYSLYKGNTLVSNNIEVPIHSHMWSEITGKSDNNEVIITGQNSFIDLGKKTNWFWTRFSGENWTFNNTYTGGGWARNLMEMKDAEENAYFRIGAQGSGQSFTHMYIGPAYSNYWLSLNDTRALFNTKPQYASDPTANNDLTRKLYVDNQISSHSHTWSAITGKPTTFTPSSHTHTIANITNLQSTLDKKLEPQNASTVSNDCNNITTTSIYQGSWSSNRPTEASINGTLITTLTSHVSPSYMRQIYLSESSTKMYTRVFTYTTSWQEWEQIGAWSAITGKPTTFTPSSHTHTISNITNLQSTLDDKVDKVSGKGLSTNDYTTTEKNKLAGIATGAQVNRPIASTAQAQAGTDNTTVMTPLRVKEAIASNPSGLGLTKDMIDTALTGSGSNSIQLGIATSSSGDFSLALGRSASAGGTSSTAIGHGAQTGTSSNLLQLGSSFTLSTLRSRVQLTITSDIRDKTDIEEVPKALDFIKDLTPITYVSNDRENYISEEQKETDTYKDYLMVEDYDRVSHSQGIKKGSRRRVGLSAQEVREKLIEHYGSDNYANVVNDNFVEFEEKKLDIPKGLENKLTMSYETLVPFLIKAIQEQQELIEELKKKIEL